MAARRRARFRPQRHKRSVLANRESSRSCLWAQLRRRWPHRLAREPTIEYSRGQTDRTPDRQESSTDSCVSGPEDIGGPNIHGIDHWPPTRVQVGTSAKIQAAQVHVLRGGHSHGEIGIADTHVVTWASDRRRRFCRSLILRQRGRDQREQDETDPVYSPDRGSHYILSNRQRARPLASNG